MIKIRTITPTHKIQLVAHNNFNYNKKKIDSPEPKPTENCTTKTFNSTRKRTITIIQTRANRKITTAHKIRHFTSNIRRLQQTKNKKNRIEISAGASRRPFLSEWDRSVHINCTGLLQQPVLSAGSQARFEAGNFKMENTINIYEYAVGLLQKARRLCNSYRMLFGNGGPLHHSAL